MKQRIMNKKGVYFLLLLMALFFVCILLPAQVARAEEHVCSECGNPMKLEYSDSGYHVYYCTNPNCIYYDYLLPSSIENHSLDANCYCSVCNSICHKTEYCPDGVHTTPTCTEPGVEYDGACYHCMRCGQYVDAYDQPVGTVTPAQGHDWKIGWTIDGDVHYHACTRCTARSDEAAHSFGDWKDNGDGTHTGKCICGKEETEAHDWQWTSGFLSHWQECSGCHAEKDEADHVLKQEVQWEADRSRAYSTLKCDCGFADYDTSYWITSTTVDPNCTEAGSVTYKASFVKLDHYSSSITDPIPALGHDLVSHDAQAATCTDIGWDAYDTCTRCPYTTYKEIPALSHDLVHHDAQDPTCTEVGWDAYDTCTRCTYTTYKEIPALGHDLVHHDAQDPTCTAIGWDAYDTCTRCTYTTYVEKAALGHTEVIDPAVAATCTETGLTEGKHCSVCSTVLLEQKTVEALGHDWGEWQVTTAPQIGKAGERQRTCSRCDEAEKEAIAALIGYTISEGADCSWTNGGTGSISLTVKRSEDDEKCYSHYLQTQIDGNPVAVSAKAGSTIVTISADILEKLTAGTHTVTIKFDDGEAEGKLTINEAESQAAPQPTQPAAPQQPQPSGPQQPQPNGPQVPATGDNSNIGLWIALLIGSMLTMLLTILTGRIARAKNK